MATVVRCWQSRLPTLLPPRASALAKSTCACACLPLFRHYSNPDAVLPTKATLEAIGFQVGFQMVERCAPLCALRRPSPSHPAAPRSRSPPTLAAAPPPSRRSLTRERARFAEPLDAIKFLCKDFWSEVFKKQVDNLKTNYRARARCGSRFLGLACLPHFAHSPMHHALQRRGAFPS